jgi:hypothetical protein
MRIDKIIFSSDDSHYLDFWEINSEICRKKLGITPILFRITDNESDFYMDKWGIVKNVEAIPGISPGFQAQIYRMYSTRYFLDECVMTSDIDMLLINKNFIDQNTENISDDSLVILNSDAYDSERPECTGIYSGPDRYPICYIAGKGDTFNKILNTDVTFREYCQRLIGLNLGWDTDEVYFGRCVNNQSEVPIIKIPRGYSSNFYCPNRIEKHHFQKKGIFSIDLSGKIDLNSFIDCHCSHPYKDHKDIIDNIKNSILND